MELTIKFAQDAQRLTEILQSAHTQAQVLSALGVTEAALQDPFNVVLEGGYAEFTNLRSKNWAVSDNEVLVFGQLKSMLFIPPDFPYLGPKALVSYDSQVLAVPTNPVDNQVYRLEADDTAATGLAWKLRPVSDIDDLPTAIVDPMTIAIGQFDTLPESDLAFDDCQAFFDWLTAHRVFNTLTLVFNQEDVHSFRDGDEPGGDPYAGDATGYSWQKTEGLPVDLSPYFRGNGRLVFRSADIEGESAPGVPTVFSHLCIAGVSLTIEAPLTFTRDTSVSPCWVVNIEHSQVQVNQPITVYQSSTLAMDPSTPHSPLFSTRFFRCSLSSGPAGSVILREDSNHPEEGYHWGLIQSCKLDNWNFSGAIHQNIDQGDPIADWRLNYRRLGWRVVNSTVRGPHLYVEEDASGLEPPLNLTFVNCRIFVADLILGALAAVNFNAVHCFIRAQHLQINDSSLAPTVVKIMGSSVLARKLTIQYPLLQAPVSGAVDRTASTADGWIHLQASAFGTVDGQLGALLTGDPAVKPTIFAEAGSRIFLPETEYRDGLIVLSPDTEASTIVRT